MTHLPRSEADSSEQVKKVVVATFKEVIGKALSSDMATNRSVLQ
jgi:hypothetical protein